MIQGRVMELKDGGSCCRRGDHAFVDLPRPGDRVVLGNGDGELETLRVVRLKHLPISGHAPKVAGPDPIAMVYVEWEEEWNEQV